MRPPSQGLHATTPAHGVAHRLAGGRRADPLPPRLPPHRRPQPAGPRHQAPRDGASILDAARELGIRDAQAHVRQLVHEFVEQYHHERKPSGPRQPTPAATATAGQPGRRRGAAEAPRRTSHLLLPRGRTRGRLIICTLRQAHATLPQSWIQRENWEFETHSIKYQRIGDEAYYAQELFEQEELTGYLKNMLKPNKSVHEKASYESYTEARCADDLESNSAVKLYAKLPGWFTVPTPLGSYNPDWAVLIDTDEGERVYFVVEMKGSTLLDDLRNAEAGRIACGKEHFRALQVLENPARYEVAASVDQLLARSVAN